MTAYQVTQQFQAVAASAPPSFDPVTGAPVPAAVPPEIQQAQMLMQDAQQGMARRTQVEKIGKTLEALFAYSMTEQQPVDFKTAMKQLVRRACTTGVGYVEVSFERENGAAPEIVGRLEDAKARLAHLQKLMEDAAEGEVDGYSAEAFELEKMIESLMAQPEIVLREGLVFDFPASTKVIPDQMCKSLIGFQGARHLAIEYLFTKDEVEEYFGVDLGGSFTPYNDDDTKSTTVMVDDGTAPPQDMPRKGDLVCVYKYYDKPSGLVYYVADGYHKFLREPAEPDVFVEGFWPVFALTFNEVEDEDTLFPPSDAYLLRSMQDSYNKARQGKNTHRYAARPRWGYAGARSARRTPPRWPRRRRSPPRRWIWRRGRRSATCWQQSRCPASTQTFTTRARFSPTSSSSAGPRRPTTAAWPRPPRQRAQSRPTPQRLRITPRSMTLTAS